MQSRIVTISAMVAGLFVVSAMAAAKSYTVPDQFKRFDPQSTFQIKYADVDAILKAMVVDVGRSSREKAAENTAQTGTRMKTKVKRDTAKEGNRFFFEEFEENEEYQQLLHNVRLNLEVIPSQVPIEAFNRNEQLAYWLNLYNITLLDELVKIYPERNLKKEVSGKKSILDNKVLNVAGEALSLNDIQTILAVNYENDPLIIYGLYQGIVGGPNIRTRAYTSENVRRNLQDNAEEFVNSNRGTQAEEGYFEVSSLYERNERYFPNFEADLKQHLMRFIEGPERVALQSVDRLDPDIDDWSITDVYGTMNQIGGSFSNNKAAMLDSVVTQQPGPDGGATAPISASFSAVSSVVQAKTPSPSRFSPDVLTHLDALKDQVEATNLTKEGTVTLEELGEVQDETEDGEAQDDDG